MTGPGLKAAPVMQIRVELAAPVVISNEHGVLRRMIAITGGTVSGGYSGTVLPGGADFQNIHDNGISEISARYCLQLDEGIVEVESQGIRSGPPEVIAALTRGEQVDPHAYYFRTAVRMTTDAPALAGLARRLYIAVAQRLPDTVLIDLHEVE